MRMRCVNQQQLRLIAILTCVCVCGVGVGVVCVCVCVRCGSHVAGSDHAARCTCVAHVTASHFSHTYERPTYERPTKSPELPPMVWHQRMLTRIASRMGPTPQQASGLIRPRPAPLAPSVAPAAVASQDSSAGARSAGARWHQTADEAAFEVCGAGRAQRTAWLFGFQDVEGGGGGRQEGSAGRRQGG